MERFRASSNSGIGNYGLLFGRSPCCWAGGARAWSQDGDPRHLCQELAAAGYDVVDSGVTYGVPFVGHEVGTPGRIIATPRLDRDIYPAPFCRSV